MDYESSVLISTYYTTSIQEMVHCCKYLKYIYIGHALTYCITLATNKDVHLVTKMTKK